MNLVIALAVALLAGVAIGFFTGVWTLAVLICRWIVAHGG